MLRVPLGQPLFLLGALFVVVVNVLPGGLAALPGRIRAARAGKGSGDRDDPDRGGPGPRSAPPGPAVRQSRASDTPADADVKERHTP